MALATPDRNSSLMLQFGATMALDNESPNRTQRSHINRRTVFGLLVVFCIIAFGAGAYRWYRMDSEFDGCISYLSQIDVGMPVTEAVKLMDQARPDSAPISRTPENMLWYVHCVRDDACNVYPGGLADGLQCAVSNWLFGQMNRASFAFSSDGTAITGIERQLCEAFGGDSARCH